MNDDYIELERNLNSSSTSYPDKDYFDQHIWTDHIPIFWRFYTGNLRSASDNILSIHLKEHGFDIRTLMYRSSYEIQIAFLYPNSYGKVKVLTIAFTDRRFSFTGMMITDVIDVRDSIFGKWNEVIDIGFAKKLMETQQELRDSIVKLEKNYEDLKAEKTSLISKIQKIISDFRVNKKMVAGGPSVSKLLSIILKATEESAKEDKLLK